MDELAVIFTSTAVEIITLGQLHTYYLECVHSSSELAGPPVHHATDLLLQQYCSTSTAVEIIALGQLHIYLECIHSSEVLLAPSPCY